MESLPISATVAPAVLARRKMVAPVLLALLVVLAACSRSSAAGTPAGPQARKLRVGIVADHPPFAYLSGDSEPDGLDAALAQEIAQRLGSEIVWTDLPVSRLVITLQRGRLELAVVSLRRLDELGQPAAVEDSGIHVEQLAQQPSGETTVLLLAAGNTALLAEVRAALAQMDQQGLIQQLEKRYLAGP
jgi:ABC-type amino acid transport substrate-binding protein